MIFSMSVKFYENFSALKKKETISHLILEKKVIK